MSRYLVIESRDPYENTDVYLFWETLKGLANRGNEVMIFFVQNGVLPLRENASMNESISTLVKAKIKLLADGFSLKERAIDRPIFGVEKIDIKQLVLLMLEPNTKVMWH